MADTKISQYTELTPAPETDDEFVIVDKSDTTMGATGTTKWIKYSNVSPTELTKASASGATKLDFFEDTDNGTNKITVSGASAVASDKTLTLPDETGTIATQEYVAENAPQTDFLSVQVFS